MWFKSGNMSLDLREISTVTLLQEEEEKVVITMKTISKSFSSLRIMCHQLQLTNQSLVCLRR